LPACRQRFGQFGGQRPLNSTLLIPRELYAAGRQIENVMRHGALSVDKCDFDTAIFRGKSCADGVQQAGAILSNHFEQRAGGRALVIKAQVGFDFEFRRLGVRAQPRLEQPVKLRFAVENIDDRPFEAVTLWGIQLERSKTVPEVEAVDNHSSAVRKSAGFGDVHAPSIQDSRQRREQARPVASHNGKLMLVADAAETKLHRFAAHTHSHVEVGNDLLWRMRSQITPRQAVEEVQQLGAHFGQQGSDALDLLGSDLGVEALLVDTASEVVVGSDVKLP